MLDQLFGVPFYKSTIDSSAYDKQSIIDTISYNFSIDSKRNKWDNDSNLHHSYDDNEDLKFKKVSYDSVIPSYQNIIVNFLDVYFHKSVNYEFYISNYTCFGKGQHMKMHNHPNTAFSGIHYIKYNHKSHQSTLYWNPADWAFYNRSFYEQPMHEAHSSVTKHSWMFDSYKFILQEDDIVITPSILRHSVPISNSDELRIAIIFHVNII